MRNMSEDSIISRRRFLQLSVGLGLATIASATYLRYIEPHWLSVEHIEIPVLNLPASLDGKRIAQLSDIHLSHYFSQENLAGALQQVIDLAPDWLVLTGDFVGDVAAEAQALVEPLLTLEMPVYAVYGNHDYWSDNATVTRFLHQAKVNVLLNSATEVEGGLWLAGVDDLWSGHPNLRAALNDVPPTAPTILLAHEPDFFDTVLHENAPITLQLSGHSHGGQIRLPTFRQDESGYSTYAPVLPRYGTRYPIGLRQVQGRFVYTNRGLGVWPIPLRFNCQPELTLITLRST
jgi:predicted MPP superfamily phosphohydrolase